MTAIPGNLEFTDTCGKCGRIIKLVDHGYSKYYFDGITQKHICDDCFDKLRPGRNVFYGQRVIVLEDKK